MKNMMSWFEGRGRYSGVPTLLTLLFLAAGQAFASDLLIQGATVFDGTGSAPHQADVRIADGRIVEVAAAIHPVHGVTVLKAKGLALLPGLFDLHTHWTPIGTPATFPQIANAYLAHGVTTVNDFNEAPEAYMPLREWLTGLDAPTVRFAARISTPLGHGADWADEMTTRWVNSPEAARAAIGSVEPYKPDLVKVFTDGWRYNNAADNSSMDEKTLAALVEEAHKNGLRVYTHTVTVARGGFAVEAGVDNLAHSLMDQPIGAALVERMRRQGTFYIPTLAVYEPVKPGQKPAYPESAAIRQRRVNFATAMTNLRTVHDAGIPIALGTDAGMPGTPHGSSTTRELELMVQAGLSPTDALVAGMAISARAAGLDDRGVIAVGKRADLVLVVGRPWQNIADMANVKRVYVDGRELFGPGHIPPAANLADALPAQKPSALVEDFERADGRTALDTLRTDEADGGNDRTVQVSEVVDREDGGHALSIQARLSYKVSPYASVVLPLSRGAIAPVDLRRYRGVRFEVRGEAPALILELRGLHDGRWIAPVQAGASWHTVEVPFERLQAQVLNVKRTPVSGWKGNNIQQLRFSASGTPGTKVWFEVDNVGFY